MARRTLNRKPNYRLSYNQWVKCNLIGFMMLILMVLFVTFFGVNTIASCI